jgi:hypothetical protein
MHHLYFNEEKAAAILSANKRILELEAKVKSQA